MALPTNITVSRHRSIRFDDSTIVQNKSTRSRSKALNDVESCYTGAPTVAPSTIKSRTPRSFADDDSTIYTAAYTAAPTVAPSEAYTAAPTVAPSVVAAPNKATSTTVVAPETVIFDMTKMGDEECFDVDYFDMAAIEEDDQDEVKMRTVDMGSNIYERMPMSKRNRAWSRRARRAGKLTKGDESISKMSSLSKVSSVDLFESAYAAEEERLHAKEEEARHHIAQKIAAESATPAGATVISSKTGTSNLRIEDQDDEDDCVEEVYSETKGTAWRAKKLTMPRRIIRPLLDKTKVPSSHVKKEDEVTEEAILAAKMSKFPLSAMEELGQDARVREQDEKKAEYIMLAKEKGVNEKKAEYLLFAQQAKKKQTKKHRGIMSSSAMDRWGRKNTREPRRKIKSEKRETEQKSKTTKRQLDEAKEQDKEKVEDASGAFHKLKSRSRELIRLPTPVQISQKAACKPSSSSDKLVMQSPPDCNAGSDHANVSNEVKDRDDVHTISFTWRRNKSGKAGKPPPSPNKKKANAFKTTEAEEQQPQPSGTTEQEDKPNQAEEKSSKKKPEEVTALAIIRGASPSPAPSVTGSLGDKLVYGAKKLIPPMPSPSRRATSPDAVRSVTPVTPSTVSTSSLAKTDDSPKATTKEKHAWKAVVDKNSFKTYYYNKVTREVTWIKPAGFLNVEDEAHSDKVCSDTTVNKGSDTTNQPAKSGSFNDEKVVAALDQKDPATQQTASAQGVDNSVALKPVCVLEDGSAEVGNLEGDVDSSALTKYCANDEDTCSRDDLTVDSKTKSNNETAIVAMSADAEMEVPLAEWQDRSNQQEETLDANIITGEAVCPKEKLIEEGTIPELEIPLSEWRKRTEMELPKSEKDNIAGYIKEVKSTDGSDQTSLLETANNLEHQQLPQNNVGLNSIATISSTSISSSQPDVKEMGKLQRFFSKKKTQEPTEELEPIQVKDGEIELKRRSRSGFSFNRDTSKKRVEQLGEATEMKHVESTRTESTESSTVGMEMKAEHQDEASIRDDVHVALLKVGSHQDTDDNPNHLASMEGQKADINSDKVTDEVDTNGGIMDSLFACTAPFQCDGNANFNDADYSEQHTSSTKPSKNDDVNEFGTHDPTSAADENDNAAAVGDASVDTKTSKESSAACDEGSTDNAVKELDEADTCNKYWRSKLDSKTNKLYYYNKRTKEVSWNKPPGFSDDSGKKTRGNANRSSSSSSSSSSSTSSCQDSGDIKAGGQKKAERNDKDTEREQLICTSDGDTPAASAASASIERYWRATVDKTTGKTYYFNKKTKQVSWTKPSTL